MPERSVIANLLMDNSLVAECELSPEDFTEPAYQQIYGAIMQLAVQQKPFDAVILSEHLEERTGRGGWLPVLGGLVKDTPYNVANFPKYAGLVREKATERKAMAIGQQLASDGDIDAATTALMAMSMVRKGNACSVISAVKAAVEGIEAVMEGGNSGVMTGLKDLDDIFGGFHKSDLVVIAGRPGMGKTAVMLNIANNCSVPAGIMSGEQSSEQVGQRFLAINGEIAVHMMRNGRLNQDDWQRAADVLCKMSDRKIYINDKPTISILDIQRQARKWKHNDNIDVLFVDYLQKIVGHGDNKREEVSGVVVGLKNLARELDIPVVVLAQVKRDVDARPNKRAYMSDVAESGVIEREADQIITLYRDEVYNENSPQAGILEMIVCKNRHGVQGTVNTTWIPDYIQVKDYSQTWA